MNSEDLLRKLDNYVQEHQQYQDAYSDAREWIKDTKQNIANCTECEGDRYAVSVKNKLDRLIIYCEGQKDAITIDRLSLDATFNTLTSNLVKCMNNVEFVSFMVTNCSNINRKTDYRTLKKQQHIQARNVAQPETPPVPCVGEHTANAAPPSVGEHTANAVPPTDTAHPVSTAGRNESYKGTFQVALKQIYPAPLEYQCRPVNRNWVRELCGRISMEGFEMPKIPVMFHPREVELAFSGDNVEHFTFICLGGNHLVSAMKELYPESRQITVDVHSKMCTEAAVKVGNRHNVRAETFPMTFQDKVCQARRFGIQMLETTNVDDKHNKDLIKKMANLDETKWKLLEKIFHNYDSQNMQSIPVTFFKTMVKCSPVLQEKYLRLVATGSLSLTKAAHDLATEKELDLLRTTFVANSNLSTWEEALIWYPDHTSEEQLKEFLGLGITNGTIPSTFKDHIEDATKFEPVRKRFRVEIKMWYCGKAVRKTPQIEKIMEDIDKYTTKQLGKIQNRIQTEEEEE